MAGEFKEVKAVGNYVVIKFISVQRELYRKRGELYVPNAKDVDGSNESFMAIVHDIGPNVENPNFKIGDEVVFNQYDMKAVENDKEEKFGIVQGHNIMAVLK